MQIHCSNPPMGFQGFSPIQIVAVRGPGQQPGGKTVLGSCLRWALLSLPVKLLREPWSPVIPTEARSVPTVGSFLAVWQHLVSPPRGELGEAVVAI